jgi:hypothetical protein
MSVAYKLEQDVLQANFSAIQGASQRQTFNYGLAAGPCSLSSRTKAYTSAASAKVDFDAGLISAEQYRAVTDAFNQATNKPTRVYVGRVDYSVAKVVTIALTGTDDGAWVVTLNGTPYTFTASGSTTDEAGTGLQGEINGSDDFTAAFDSGTDVLTITGLKGDDYTVEVSSPNSNLGAPTTTTAALSIADELDEVLSESDAWAGFSLVDTTPDDRDVELAALWGQNNARLYCQQLGAASVKDATDDLTTRTKAISIFGGWGWFHAATAEQFVFSLMCERLTANPDLESPGWSAVPLTGFTPTTLTPDEATNLRAKGIGFYSTLLGKSVTSKVTALGGELRPDNVLGMYWARQRIMEDWANLAISYAQTKRKIPYNDQGFQLVAEPVRRRLQQGVDVGHFLDGSVRVIVPTLADLEETEDFSAKRVPIQAGVVNLDGVEAFELDAYGFSSLTSLIDVFGTPETLT